MRCSTTQNNHYFGVSAVLLLALWLTAAAPAVALQDNRAFKPGTTLYIHSLKGLSLRADASVRAQRLSSIRYGGKVKHLAYALPKIRFQFDNIRGYWIKVRYRDKQGYVFSGFVSPFPAPAGTTTLAGYARQLGSANSSTESSHRATKQATSKPQGSDNLALTLGKATALDGYLIARRLFGIPDRMRPPRNYPVNKITVLDPKKPSQVLAHELNFELTKTQSIHKIEYLLRKKGYQQRSSINIMTGNKIRLQTTASASPSQQPQ